MTTDLSMWPGGVEPVWTMLEAPAAFVSMFLYRTDIAQKRPFPRTQPVGIDDNRPRGDGAGHRKGTTVYTSPT